jgi:hypothetical protein
MARNKIIQNHKSARMKKLLIVISTLVVQQTIAQECTCLLLSTMNPNDTIYQNGHLIEAGDSIDLAGKVRLNHPSVIIKIQDVKSRSYPVSLSESIKVLKFPDNKRHSELYEVSIGEYFRKLGTQTQNLNTRNGEFDWLDYFRNFNNDPGRRLLIVNNEKIPLVSKYLTLTPNVSLFACRYKGGDSSTILLHIESDSLILNYASFGLNSSTDNITFSWKLKLGFREKGKMVYKDISEKITSRMMDQNEFESTLHYLYEGVNKDSTEQVKVVNLFFQISYGKANPFLLNQ